MGTIQLDFFVDAPLEQVWELGLQPERIPEWQFDIVEVRNITGPLDHVSATYTLVYRRMGRNLDSPVEVTRFEPRHVIETTGKPPVGGRFVSTTRMEPEGSGTHVHWRMDYALPGGFVGCVLDRLFRGAAFERTVRQYNENLKALAEGRTPPHVLRMPGRGNAGG